MTYATATNPATTVSVMPLKPLSTVLYGQQASSAEGSIDSLLADLVTGLAAAVFIVDRGRRIIYANASAENLLRDGSVLRRQDQQLRSATECRGQLGQAIAQVLGCTIDGNRRGSVGLSHSPLSVTLTDGTGRPCIAQVQAIGSRTTHAVVILPAAAPLRFEHAEAFALAYDLTEMEAHVLVALTNGQAPTAAADALHIGATTLTTHIKHIFDKTGVRRQSLVVALFLRTLSPLQL
jgi:DNA-binding CsgD family transcriptional regulator